MSTSPQKWLKVYSTGIWLPIGSGLVVHIYNPRYMGVVVGGSWSAKARSSLKNRLKQKGLRHGSRGTALS
jgi:hypothetical protein